MAQTVSARAAAAAARGAAHLVSPRHNSVAIASHLKAQPLRLQPNHRDVGEPLLTCAERQFRRTQHVPPKLAGTRARTDRLLKRHAASCTAEGAVARGGTWERRTEWQVYRTIAIATRKRGLKLRKRGGGKKNLRALRAREATIEPC